MEKLLALVTVFHPYWCHSRLWIGQIKNSEPEITCSHRVSSSKQKMLQTRSLEIIFQNIISQPMQKKHALKNTVALSMQLLLLHGSPARLMFLFALLIFTLFIQLTIASAKEEIVLLITLGAAPQQLQSFLRKQFLPANIITIIVTIVIVSVLQFILQKTLAAQNIFISQYLSYYTVIAAAIILLLLTFVNNRSIKKYIQYNS